jgi:hypothetical protein
MPDDVRPVGTREHLRIPVKPGHAHEFPMVVARPAAARGPCWSQRTCWRGTVAGAPRRWARPGWHLPAWGEREQPRRHGRAPPWPHGLPLGDDAVAMASANSMEIIQILFSARPQRN